MLIIGRLIARTDRSYSRRTMGPQDLARIHPRHRAFLAVAGHGSLLSQPYLLPRKPHRCLLPRKVVAAASYSRRVPTAASTATSWPSHRRLVHPQQPQTSTRWLPRPPPRPAAGSQPARRPPATAPSSRRVAAGAASTRRHRVQPQGRSWRGVHPPPSRPSAAAVAASWAAAIYRRSGTSRARRGAAPSPDVRLDTFSTRGNPHVDFI
jgi:hypothetical protein